MEEETTTQSLTNRIIDSPTTIFHLNLEPKKPKVHWSLNNGVLFPRKLYQAACAGQSLITWNDKGNGVIIDHKRFEDQVLTTYPDLVEIPTFANIRRQFREYGYQWFYLDDTDQFMFTHQFFRKGQPDLLDMVVTRRKRARVGWGLGGGGARLVAKREDHPIDHLTDQGTIGERMRRSSLVLPRRWPVAKENYNGRYLFGDSKTERAARQPHRNHLHKLSLRIVDRNDTEPPVKRPVGRPRKYPSSVTPKSSAVLKSGSEPDTNQSDKKADAASKSESDNENDFEEEFWNNCLPHMIREDPDLQAAFDIACLESAMLRRHPGVRIPVYFYGDGYDYNPVTSWHMIPRHYPLYFPPNGNFPSWNWGSNERWMNKIDKFRYTPTEFPYTPSEFPYTPSKFPCTPSDFLYTPSDFLYTLSELPCTPSEFPYTPSEFPCTPSEFSYTPSEFPCTPSAFPYTLNEYPYATSEFSSFSPKSEFMNDVKNWNKEVFASQELGNYPVINIVPDEENEAHTDSR